ncbi:MAG: GntR family transcriptional regulator [Rhizobiaceae bacterium]
MSKRAAVAPVQDRARLSSSDHLVRDIVRGLYEGRFVAGQRLIEPDLMRLYNVSRSTVREAIKQLTAEGAVTQTAFRGAQVRHLSRQDARDVLQLLEVTIGLAARLAAENINKDGMREPFLQAYETLTGFAEAADSFELVRARNRFYRAMARTGGNRELERLLPSFSVHLIRTHLKMPRRDRFADYRAMAEAILAGNPAAAEKAGRQHMQRTLDALDDAPDSIFAPAAPRQTSFEDED